MKHLNFDPIWPYIWVQYCWKAKFCGIWMLLCISLTVLDDCEVHMKVVTPSSVVSYMTCEQQCIHFECWQQCCIITKDLICCTTFGIGCIVQSVNSFRQAVGKFNKFIPGFEPKVRPPLFLASVPTVLSHQLCCWLTCQLSRFLQYIVVFHNKECVAKNYICAGIKKDIWSHQSSDRGKNYMLWFCSEKIICFVAASYCQRYWVFGLYPSSWY
jgi:hypothetical protein